MFENAEKVNADISKDKRTVYRYHRLSKEDKMELYAHRPDLNTKDSSHLLRQPLLPGGERRSGSSGSTTSVSGGAAVPIKSALKKPKAPDSADGRMVSRMTQRDEEGASSNGSSGSGGSSLQSPCGGQESSDSYSSPSSIGPGGGRRVLKIGREEEVILDNSDTLPSGECGQS